MPRSTDSGTVPSPVIRNVPTSSTAATRSVGRSSAVTFVMMGASQTSRTPTAMTRGRKNIHTMSALPTARRWPAGSLSPWRVAMTRRNASIGRASLADMYPISRASISQTPYSERPRPATSMGVTTKVTISLTPLMPRATALSEARRVSAVAGGIRGVDEDTSNAASVCMGHLPQRDEESLIQRLSAVVSGEAKHGRPARGLQVDEYALGRISVGGRERGHLTGAPILHQVPLCALANASGENGIGRVQDDDCVKAPRPAAQRARPPPSGWAAPEIRVSNHQQVGERVERALVEHDQTGAIPRRRAQGVVQSVEASEMLHFVPEPGSGGAEQREHCWHMPRHAARKEPNGHTPDRAAHGLAARLELLRKRGLAHARGTDQFDHRRAPVQV